MSVVAFKTLGDNGRSPYVNYAWPLPQEDQPGAWVEADGPLRICKCGIHGWKFRPSATEGQRLYEIELDGQIIEDAQKYAAQRGRLLRRVPWVPVVDLKKPRERAIQLCVKCGKPHAYYEIGPRGLSTWADPHDGHCFERESWEAVARRALEALAA